MAEVERKVSKAKSLLIIDHPFFGTGVSRRPIQYTDSVPTAAMSATGQMYINPRFIEGGTPENGPLTVKNIMFLLAHEAMHYMLMHGTRMQHRNHKAWNVACVAFDTPVTMEDGTTKPAGLITPGDVVATPFGGGFISDVAFTSKQNIVELDLGSGYKITCTSDHKILTQRGYVYAEELRAGEDTCAVDAEYGRVPAGELSDDVREGYGGASWAGSKTGLLPVGTAEAFQGSHDPKAPELERRGDSDGTTGGVLGRDRGRGRDDQLPDEGEQVSALRAGIEHGLAAMRVAGVPWDVRCVGGEHGRQIVLAHVDQRPPSERPAGAAATVLDREEDAGGAGAVSDRAAAGAYQQLYPDSQHAEAVRGVEGVKFRQVQSVRRVAGQRLVVDLVSSQQCFYAQGVVVHNCDKVINDTLIDAKVGDFIKGGIHMRDARNFAAEELYDENDQGQNGNGPGGIGNDVQPPTNGDGSPMDASQVRQAEAQAKIEAVQCAKAAKAVGKLPGSIERMVDELVQVSTPWYDHLERYMTSFAAGGKSWKRPNKRMISKGIYLKGKSKQPRMGKVVIGVDTSGSIGQAELNFFGGHVNRILETCQPEEVIIVYCDADVAHVDRYEPDDMPIQLAPHGGGGTDLMKIFDWVRDNGVEPEVAIILTDGYTPFREAPDYDVVWAMTTSVQAPFGLNLPIRME